MLRSGNLTFLVDYMINAKAELELVVGLAKGECSAP